MKTRTLMKIQIVAFFLIGLVNAPALSVSMVYRCDQAQMHATVIRMLHSTPRELTEIPI